LEEAVTSLEERITQAFSDDVPSDEIGALIEEAEAAADAVAKAAEQSREQALDPALSPAGVEKARTEMEAVAFRRDRLAVAVRRLREQLDVARQREENAARQAVYDAAREERNAVAADLARRWPKLEREMVRLLERLEASDEAIRLANARLPTGWGPITSADLVARDTPPVVGGQEVPRLVRTKLPAFRFDPAAPYAWPRPQRMT
jgi:DNA repair exonuclease SbcCD ATPase subunit